MLPGNVFALILEILSEAPALVGDVEGAITSWHASHNAVDKTQAVVDAANKIVQAAGAVVAANTPHTATAA